MSHLNYLEKLLEGVGTEWQALGDLVTLRRGRVMSKGFLSENTGIFPVYSSQTANDGMIGSIDTYDFDGEYISWTTDGANAGTIFYRKGKFSITNVCGLMKIIDENLLNYKYLYYWLTTEAKKYVYSGMGNPKLMSHQVEKIAVPIPCPDNPEKS
ncbi:restriction endonuclease subunit S, partial [Vibrio cholerae]